MGMVGGSAGAGIAKVHRSATRLKIGHPEGVFESLPVSTEISLLQSMQIVEGRRTTRKQLDFQQLKMVCTV